MIVIDASPGGGGSLRQVGVAEGFQYSVSQAGTVTFTHHGRPAGTLRGKAAAAFLAFASNLDEESEAVQQRMARLTGNYKRGNERRAHR